MHTLNSLAAFKPLLVLPCLKPSFKETSYPMCLDMVGTSRPSSFSQDDNAASIIMENMINFFITIAIYIEGESLKN